ncbi:MAG: hypothetical protein M0Z41_20630 [Peptococcaceae bacterium]|jgi:hypothetical protein|nr:hypothetical protein [Peptococcaceae bacterium]
MAIDVISNLIKSVFANIREINGLAPLLLQFFGPEYDSNGTAVLRWVLLANSPLAIASFYNTVNQVRKHLAHIIVQAFVTSALTIGIGYTLANLVVAPVVVVPLWRAMREVPTGGELAGVKVAAVVEVVPAREG